MNERQKDALDRLLVAWNRHEDARHHNIRELADTRWALDDARARMRSSISSIR